MMTHKQLKAIVNRTEDIEEFTCNQGYVTMLATDAAALVVEIERLWEMLKVR